MLVAGYQTDFQLISTALSDSDNITVKIYHGYGHTHDLVLYGHVLQGHASLRKKYTNNILHNIIHLVKIFMVKPVPGRTVRLVWGQQRIETITAKDGFFKFEWKSEEHIAAGWHPVTVELLDDQKSVVKSGDGKMFIPHVTQLAFVSDIDDTVLISHSATTWKRLRVLFTRNPHSRKAFEDVVEHYSLLADAHTEPDVPNPFFYVSSSEWNLYNDLNDFFKHNKLPAGVFLLNEIKNWKQLFKTGKTKHLGKLTRVVRLLEVFPKQRFVLLGDNSQKDPEIYAAVANKYPERIVAIYVRNIDKSKSASARASLDSVSNKAIHTVLFNSDKDAIQYSRQIGLVDDAHAH